MRVSAARLAREPGPRHAAGKSLQELPRNLELSHPTDSIARKLYALPGVVEVRADVGNNIAYVVPQKDKNLSAKSMWEAVEAAGFQVAKLEGPQGTFMAKPTR